MLLWPLPRGGGGLGCFFVGLGCFFPLVYFFPKSRPNGSVIEVIQCRSANGSTRGYWVPPRRYSSSKGHGMPQRWPREGTGGRECSAGEEEWFGRCWFVVQVWGGMPFAEGARLGKGCVVLEADGLGGMRV